MALHDRKLSAKHGLSKDEQKFCKIYISQGKTGATEAYRRAFMRKRRDGEFVEVTGLGDLNLEDLSTLDPIDNRAITKRAAAILKRDIIADYCEELEAPTGDHARQTLREQAIFGNDQAARAAATKILEQEDKLGFRDAVEQYTEIMCAAGCEVVVPVPGGGEVSFPMREMFPRYKEALPPVEVMEKTRKTLAAYIKKLKERDADV